MESAENREGPSSNDLPNGNKYSPSKPGTSKQGTPIGLSDESSKYSFLEAGPSKSFASSTIQPSTSRGGTPQSGGKKKLSLRKLSIEAFLDIPLNDDNVELIEEKEKSLTLQEKSETTSETKKDDDLDLDVSALTSMTLDQMQEHMAACLQYYNENKITPKNAFALKLIDVMTILAKNEEDKSNFAAMACQLDAGAKIYSSRVDAVYQQVIKLVETCMYSEKQKKQEATDDPEEDEDNEGEGEGKDKRKKLRKRVIATNDQISRHPKENDPKDMFVRLDALPGDILNKAKCSSDDLSLSLDKNMPFWIDWQKYKPTRPEGENDIPEIEITNRKLRPNVDLDSEIDLASIAKLEPLLLSKNETKNGMSEEEEDGDDTDYPPDNDQDNLMDNDQNIDEGLKDEEEDVPVVSMAKLRMASEGSKQPSTHEVIKALFHEPGESDYHYLKMDRSNFWAGPSYWKRPQGPNLAENKRKILKRKKDPVELLYKVTGEEEESTSKDLHARNKKAATLSKRTMAKWSKSKVTYPQDIHFDPETFHMLFNMAIVAEVANSESEENKEKPEDENGSEGESESRENACGSPDVFGDEEEANNGEDFKGFSPAGSSNDEGSVVNNGNTTDGFKGWPAPDDEENGFQGFTDQEIKIAGLKRAINQTRLEYYKQAYDSCHYETHQKAGSSSRNTEDSKEDASNPSACDAYKGESLDPMSKRQEKELSSQNTEESQEDAHKPSACDAYEGENLVPMVKTVKVDPIRIVAKPNRVDMQQLKCVMINIIRRAIEDEENPNNDESPRRSVLFRNVLQQVFSSEQLDHRTREDLTVSMSFLCLLTLANENNLHLTRNSPEDPHDVLIEFV